MAAAYIISDTNIRPNDVTCASPPFFCNCNKPFHCVLQKMRNIKFSNYWRLSHLSRRTAYNEHENPTVLCFSTFCHWIHGIILKGRMQLILNTFIFVELNIHVILYRQQYDWQFYVTFLLNCRLLKQILHNTQIYFV